MEVSHCGSPRTKDPRHPPPQFQAYFFYLLTLWAKEQKGDFGLDLDG